MIKGICCSLHLFVLGWLRVMYECLKHKPTFLFGNDLQKQLRWLESLFKWYSRSVLSFSYEVPNLLCLTFNLCDDDNNVYHLHYLNYYSHLGCFIPNVSASVIPDLLQVNLLKLESLLVGYYVLEFSEMRIDNSDY